MANVNITADPGAITFSVNPDSLFLVAEATQRSSGATDFITLPVYAKDAGEIDLLLPNATIPSFDTANDPDDWIAVEAGVTLKAAFALPVNQVVTGKIIRTPVKNGSPLKQYFLVEGIGA